MSPSTTSESIESPIAVEVRYFAAAAEAADTAGERLELPAGTTLAALREQLAGRSLEMARIVGISSFLVNALSTPADSLTPLKDGDAVDILPPFAGG
ncbi:MoaD/ThiS family protein [Actinomyces oricola]|uniref:MoaD/ThiS family protein n=1 Tax=Actinomyces oricola TaxID=206043 RepID=UPI000FFE7B86|nr:MoaD/ThiS family protein [Actinomyces oricola]